MAPLPMEQGVLAASASHGGGGGALGNHHYQAHPLHIHHQHHGDESSLTGPSPSASHQPNHQTNHHVTQTLPSPAPAPVPVLAPAPAPVYAAPVGGEKRKVSEDDSTTKSNSSNDEENSSNPSSPLKKRKTASGAEETVLPESLEPIEQYEDQDVLSGRGGGTNAHPGNRHFRDLINLHRRTYLKARKNDKPAISRSIVKAIRDAGGRFLRKHKDHWVEIGDVAAREKTSQALRQRAPEMRQLLFESDNAVAVATAPPAMAPAQHQAVTTAVAAPPQHHQHHHHHQPTTVVVAAPGTLNVSQGHHDPHAPAAHTATGQESNNHVTHQLHHSPHVYYPAHVLPAPTAGHHPSEITTTAASPTMVFAGQGMNTVYTMHHPGMNAAAAAAAATMHGSIHHHHGGVGEMPGAPPKAVIHSPYIHAMNNTTNKTILPASHHHQHHHQAGSITMLPGASHQASTIAYQI